MVHRPDADRANRRKQKDRKHSDLQPDILLLQETHLPSQGTPDAQAWCTKAGWRSYFEPCLRGPRGGPSAGVAILWRPRLAITTNPATIVKGRAAAISVWLKGLGTLEVINVYGDVDAPSDAKAKFISALAAEGKRRNPPHRRRHQSTCVHRTQQT